MILKKIAKSAFDEKNIFLGRNLFCEREEFMKILLKSYLFLIGLMLATIGQVVAMGSEAKIQKATMAPPPKLVLPMRSAPPIPAKNVQELERAKTEGIKKIKDELGITDDKNAEQAYKDIQQIMASQHVTEQQARQTYKKQAAEQATERKKAINEMAEKRILEIMNQQHISREEAEKIHKDELESFKGETEETQKASQAAVAEQPKAALGRTFARPQEQRTFAEMFKGTSLEPEAPESEKFKRPTVSGEFKEPGAPEKKPELKVEAKVEEQIQLQKEILKTKAPVDIIGLGEKLLAAQKSDSTLRIDQSKAMIEKEKEKETSSAREEASRTIDVLKADLASARTKATSKTLNAKQRQEAKNKATEIQKTLTQAQKDLKVADAAVKESDKQIKARAKELAATLKKYKAVKPVEAQDKVEIEKLQKQFDSLAIVEVIRKKEANLNMLQKRRSDLLMAGITDKLVIDEVDKQLKKAAGDLEQLQTKKEELLTFKEPTEEPKTVTKTADGYEKESKEFKETTVNENKLTQKYNALKKLGGLRLALQKNLESQKKLQNDFNSGVGSKATLNPENKPTLEAVLQAGRELVVKQKAELELRTEQSNALVEKALADSSLLKESKKAVEQGKKDLADAQTKLKTAKQQSDKQLIADAESKVKEATKALKENIQKQKNQEKMTAKSDNEIKQQINILSQIIKNKTKIKPDDPAIKQLENQISNLSVILEKPEN